MIIVRGFNTKLLVIILLLSVSGAIVKIIGGVIFGSRSLFVDALTCFANIVAIISTVYFYRASLVPPDADHHYGHYKLGFGGTIVSMLAYSFVAGIAVSKLMETHKYHVYVQAVWMAVAGLLLYLGAIVLAGRAGEFFRAYAVFTVSELIESGIVIVASLGGAMVNYMIDYVGALIITIYIFVELYDTGKKLIMYLSDIAPPHEFVDKVRRLVEEHGFSLVSLKMRRISDNVVHGDIVVKSRGNIDIKELVDRIRHIKEELRERYGLDCSIELSD